MGNRLDLHAKLKAILGSNEVYFQPPESIKLTYPVIIYNKDSISARHANNKIYMKNNRYTITVIDPNPDTTIPDDILELPKCSFDRSFVSDNLNHYVLTLYF